MPRRRRTQERVFSTTCAGAFQAGVWYVHLEVQQHHHLVQLALIRNADHLQSDWKASRSRFVQLGAARPEVPHVGLQEADERASRTGGPEGARF